MASAEMGERWYPACYGSCSANMVRLNADFRQTRDDPEGAGDATRLVDLEVPTGQRMLASQENFSDYELASPSPLSRKPSPHSSRPSSPSPSLHRDEDWARLPDHILQSIFGSFSGQDLAACVGRVCRRWYLSAYSPRLWRRLHVRLSEATLRDEARRWSLREVLEAVEPSELSLSLTNGEAALPDHLLLPLLPRLRSLDLGLNSGLTQPILQSLIVDPCPNLTQLNLEGIRELDDVLLGSLCRAMPQLRALCIFHCTQVSDEGLRRMAAALRGLETLSIDGIERIHDQGVRGLVRLQGHSLRRLYLDGAELTDRAIAAVAEFCPRLRLFSISFAENLTDESLASLRALRELDHLHLRKGRELTGPGLRELFLPPRGLAGLRHVSLSECSALGDEGVGALVGSSPGLVSLGLSWCWSVSELGFQHILQGLPELRFLDLIGLDMISGFIPDGRLPLLEYLEVGPAGPRVRENGPVEDEAVEELVAKRGGLLQVVNYFGELVTLASVQAKRTGHPLPRPHAYPGHLLHELKPRGACCMNSYF